MLLLLLRVLLYGFIILLCNLRLYLRHLTILSHTINLHIITPSASRPEEGHWFGPCSELTPYSANGESIHLCRQVGGLAYVKSVWGVPSIDINR